MSSRSLKIVRKDAFFRNKSIYVGEVGKLYYVTDVYCADPPSIIGGTLQGLESRDPVTGMFTYGTVMSYSCLSGGRFEDGNTAKLVQCVLNGVWNQTQFTCDCTRALLLIVL